MRQISPNLVTALRGTFVLSMYKFLLAYSIGRLPVDLSSLLNMNPPGRAGRPGWCVLRFSTSLGIMEIEHQSQGR
jgi:hypothetical protein